jgi:hypothetical protein
MPTVKCANCQYLESPSNAFNWFFCTKLQHELENGSTMAFHAQKCEAKKKPHVYPSVSLAMPTTFLNTTVAAVFRRKKHEKILI